MLVDLVKAYDNVPREEVWCCMRKSGVAEKCVRIVQDMYDMLYNSGEECGRSDGGVRGGTAPMIGFEPLFVAMVIVRRMKSERKLHGP